MRSPSRLAILLVFSTVGCGSSPQPGDDAPPDAGPIGSARAQAGGAVRGVALVDHLAYVTVGPRLAIWDLSDPTAPTLRGESEPMDGVLEAVAVVGSHAYVTQNGDLDGRLRVLDVADPAAPAVIGSIRLAAAGDTTVPLGLVADATHLYVADQEHGVSVLDLADPAAPTVLRTLDDPGVTSLQIVGTRLYAVSKGFTDDLALQAYDLSADLADLGAASFPGAASIAITDGQIAFATGIGSLEGGAEQQARDLSDLAHPIDLAIAGVGPHALRVLAGPSTVYLAAFDGLHVVDLTTPGTATIGPVLADMTERGETGALAGDLLTVVTERGELRAIDVATPTAPVAKGSADVSLCLDCGGIAIDGDHLMIADHGGGLRTARANALALDGHGAVAGDLDYEDVALADGHAFVADWFFGMRGYDVSNPAAPKALGTVDTAGYPSAIEVEHGRVYLGESTNGGALRVIDVADPAHPAELGAIATSFVWSLLVRDQIVYVADLAFGGGNGGLHIFDASNPAHIKAVGSYEACGSVVGVALDGATAVVACDDATWHILDLSNLAAPRKLGQFSVPAPNAATSVALSGTRAYLGYSTGMTVIDLADPAHPTVVAQHPTAYEVRDLKVTAPGHVVASCGAGGVYQWDVP